MEQLLYIIISLWLSTGIVSLIWFIKMNLEIRHLDKLIDKYNKYGNNMLLEFTGRNASYNGKRVSDLNEEDVYNLKYDITQIIKFKLKMEKISSKIKRKNKKVKITGEILNKFLYIFSFGRLHIEVVSGVKDINDYN